MVAIKLSSQIGNIMNTKTDQTPNSVYLLNPEIKPCQLSSAISASLSKAEALALTAATIDFDGYDPDTINNYMWTLSDLIREIKWLYEKVIPPVE
jgi:hypothetical protein